MTLRHRLTSPLRAAAGRLARLLVYQPSSPLLPIAFYGPFAAAAVAWNLLGEPPPAWALALPPAGFLLWTLLEYVLHSEVFHAAIRSPYLQALQQSHSGHHEAPHDPGRMVARLSFSLPVALLLYGLLALVLWSARLAGLVLAGVIVGYLSYEVIHYQIHLGRRTRWLIRPLVKHHLYHHHKDSSRCYGVTTPLWDWVFRTGRRPRQRASRGVPA
jgi:sterol desaturase/sphingolipid hydroxylase (fatty acid hydroxylase superfamily)